ncbi:hypothetical protein Agub_g11373 [Astrephomene gubernaculifera]|uniref:Uncharacterized protein n=1 Tax=Astrephomene gubernaculifera TaxID=47775 RepID=A0AAD3DWF5_9CHLO|nr:hypothetical protein Agub_g11373 [Astrephomene gubernaculifera]
MSGRPPPALPTLAAGGDTAAEQVPQPSSSNETQDTIGNAEPVVNLLPTPKRIEPCKSILKTGDSLKTSDYKRNISWQDQFGQSLVQVVEFEPSEHGDSDYDDMEERGCCVLM